MPDIEESAVCRAPAVEVWKLLHDPVRFTDWWAGVSRAETTGEGALLYPDALPGVAVPTRLTTGGDGRYMVVNCLLTDDVYTWTLEPHPSGCRVSVCVTIADDDKRLRMRQAEVLASLPRLVTAAEQAAGIPADSWSPRA